MVQNYNPGLVVWEITLKCNLRCLHCGSQAGEARVSELSIEEALGLCKDLAEIGFKGVTLFGGEPFLRKDWHTIAKEIKECGMKLSVVTNGFVNAKKIIPKLVRLEADSVQVGLDGSTAETHDSIRGVNGSFEKAVDFIRLSKEAGLPLGVITTVSKTNFKELPRIKDFVVKEGVDWQIQEGIPIGRLPKEMVLSEQEYYSLGLFVASVQRKCFSKKILVTCPHNFGFHSQFIPNLNPFVKWDGCWAGKKVLGVQSNGDVKGCLALTDEFIEGNVRDRSVVEIWNDPKGFVYSRRFRGEDLGENCRGCRYALSCKGGCSTRSYVLTGKLHNDPYCFYRIEQQMIQE